MLFRILFEILKSELSKPCYYFRFFVIQSGDDDDKKKLPLTRQLVRKTKSHMIN